MIPISIQSRALRKTRKIPDRLLRSLFRRSGEIAKITIIRDAVVDGKSSWQDLLRSCLREPSPAIRRNAAWGLGWLRAETAADALLQAAANERCDTVRFQMALAARQCGTGIEDAFSVIKTGARRKIHGAYGVRRSGGFSGWSIEEAADLWSLANAHESAEQLSWRAETLARIEANRDDRRAVLSLGLMGHPDDVNYLKGMWLAAGRRMRLALCKAMGLHGHPLLNPSLVDALNSVAVDPGHGFALRMESAVALGRLGLSLNGRTLIRALENEALDFEGRPGAGLGVQHSVRGHILAALGEIQTEPDLLCQYLGNTHGSAEGGFYLPAMDALWKCGQEAPLHRMMGEADLVAANALGVIRQISGPTAVRPWLNDPRELVAQVARGNSV